MIWTPLLNYSTENGAVYFHIDGKLVVLYFSCHCYIDEYLECIAVTNTDTTRLDNEAKFDDDSRRFPKFAESIIKTWIIHGKKLIKNMNELIYSLSTIIAKHLTEILFIAYK